MLTNLRLGVIWWHLLDGLVFRALHRLHLKRLVTVLVLVLVLALVLEY